MFAKNSIVKLINSILANSKLCFLLVGGSAALVHQVVVIALVQFTNIQPLRANVAGFLLAWLVSYFGHYYLTFSAKNPHKQAAPKFFLTSLLGFAVNQTMYALLLRFTVLNYAVALFLVLLIVAVMTYLIGKFWAFSI